MQTQQNPWLATTRSRLAALLVAGTLLAPCAARAQLVNTTTTGASFDLAAPAAWDNGVVPNANGSNTYAPNFDVAGIYTAPSGTVLTWEGVTFSASGVELKPTSPLTINIGAGGITGSATRLGSTDGFLSINVGGTTQTWTAAQGNVGASISGTTSAIINLNSTGTSWFRGDNGGFNGTWKLNTAGGLFQSASSSSMGSGAARVEMADGTSIRLNSGGPTGHTQEANLIIKGGATITVDSGVVVALLGDLSSATTPGTPASLVMATGTGTANTLIFGGDHSAFFGTLTFNRSNTAGFLVCFNEESRQSFTIGANQFAEGASTASTPVIRVGTGTGATTLMFSGGFVLDTSAADTTAGNTWRLVDQTGLSVSYTSTFYVEGFLADPDGITWRRPENGRTWTYSEATGILTVTAGGTALPAPPPRDVFFMGGQSNAKYDVASGIIDVMTKSGSFNNPMMVSLRHSGQAISLWYDGAPRQFYDSDFFGLTGTYDQDYQSQGKLQKALTSSGGPRKFRGFFWWQGEADKSVASQYATRFLGMTNQLATDTGQSIGTGADQWTYHIALPDDLALSYESIRAAQVAMINANPTQGTYYDTRPYPRFTPNDNPHVSEDLDYFIGVEMAKQLIAMRGLPPAELTAPNQTLVKTPGDTLSNGSTRKLSRLSGWLPAAIPGPTNILRFTNALTAPVSYDIGGSPDFGNLKIRGLQHQAPVDITITYNSGWGLEIGDAGLEVTNANLVLGSSIVTTANQTWSLASGRSLIANNANAVLDLRNATLTGAGTYDLRAGTYDFGSSPSTGNLSFSGGGQTVKFSTASNGGSPGPLGVTSDFRSGVGANATFQFTGSGSASWNRNLRFDTAATPGRTATFEITTPGATFSTSGILGVSSNSTTNILNLKLGGAGNLAITSTGGVVTNGTAVCNVEKIGAGTLTLGGSNSYGGATLVQTGTLLVANPSGSATGAGLVTVAAGATLGGNGTVSGATVLASGATLGPGLAGSTGTLTLGGGLTLNAGATLAVKLAAVGASDRVSIAGTFSANGTTTINATALAGFTGGTFPIIIGATGINASNFALGTLPANTTGSLSVSGGTLNLTLGSASLPSITSSSSATGMVGTPFSYQITAINSPTGYGATGLPANLSVNTATGLISGTPAATGTSTVTISATNASGTVETTLTITTSATRVGEWLPDASGNWSTAANWTLLPNAISDVAKLTRNITANRTVTLDQAVTLGGLETGDTDGTHAYLLAPGTGGSLAWSNNGGGASITQLSTSKGDTISTPSRLLDNLAITNNSANALTISGAVAVEKTNATLTQTGGGSVQLSGGLTFTPASGASFTFSGTTGALTSLGPLGLAADMGAFSLSGSPLALAGSVTVGANTTATLSNAIPAGAITKLGGGSLSLSGLSATPASNHPGLTTIDQGTLRLSQDSAFTGGLTFGASDGSANPGSLDLANASASFAGAMSVRSINATANTITIGTGQKLTNTGDVTWGYNVASGTPTLKLTVGGGGEWAVTASNKTFGGASGGTRNYQSEIDLSTLATFTANLRTGGSGNAGGTFRVGTNSSGAVGTYNFVKLAANSTVSADVLDVSSPSGGPGLVSLLLGSGTQVINSDTINLSRGTRDSSALKFNTTTGTIKIRGTAGGDTDRANVNMVTGTTTGGTVTSTLDLTGHTTDLFLGAVKVYAHAVATTSSLTNSYSAVFSFDQGVLDATSFQIGSKSAGSFQNPGFATVNIGGASNLTNNATLGAVTMGLVSTTDPTVSATNASLTSKLNINGSATTANFATLSMANYTGTANATINSEVNILGGTTTATGGLTMAEGNKGVVNSTLTISGGSLSLGTSGVNATNGLYRTITGATATTTLTLNGGSLNLNGNAIGGAGQLITTNFQSGTLSNVSEINNGAGLTKTGNGTLNLAGTNTYAGDTSVSAGSLVISVGGSLRLRPAAATVSNKIALSGTGSLTFDGELYLDLVAADTTVGSQWPLVQTSAAAPAYGTSFSVNSSLGAFTKVGSAWTRLAAGKVWTFTPATGVLSIATAATPLQTWAAAKGLTPGVNDAPTANPDGDTFNNLGEFAFDGDPLSATDPNKLVGMVATVGGQSVLTYTLPVRTGATFSGATEQVSLVIDGILYRVRGSTDLAAWDLVVTEVTGPDALAIQSGLPALSPGWTYRTFLAPGTTSTTPRAFLRSVVELP